MYEKTLLENNFDTSQAIHLLKKKKESDKGRVRKIKVKVKRVLQMPQYEQLRLLGPEWFERF